MKKLLDIFLGLVVLFGFTQIGNAQKNCNGPFQVDLSSNTTHTIDEVLQQLGIATLQQFNSQKPQFDMVVGGTLLLDKPGQEIAFYGTRIKMLENAKINVRNNTTLTLDNANVYGCGKRWYAIDILNATINTRNGTTIEEAVYAIKERNNSKADLQSTTFINNNYGVTVGGSSSSNIQISVSDCTFTSDYSFLSANQYVVGISVTGLDYIDLSPVSGDRNTFEYLHNGIVASTASVRVSDCDFSQITLSYVSGDPNKWQHGGYGIHIFNSNSMSVIENNTFSGIQTAIRSNKAYVNANNNTILSETGISIENVEHFSFADNTISTTVAGIQINSTYHTFPINIYAKRPNSVYHNTIDVSLTGKGIDVQATNNIVIDNNTITVENGQAGIFAIGSHGIIVKDNFIDVFGGTDSEINGIHLENCNAVDVTDNALQQFDYASCCVPKNTGIYSESSYGNYSCNKISGVSDFISFTKAGMAFLYQCDNSMLAGNEFTGLGKDLVVGSELFDVASVIGLQGDFAELKGWGNTWTGLSGGSAYNYSDFDIEKSRFLVNGYSDPEYLPATVVPAYGWFWNNPLATNDSLCVDPNNGNNGTIYDCTDLINKIIRIDTTRKFDECQKAIWKYHYFKKLLRMKRLKQLSDACLGFLNAYNNDELVKLAKVDTAIAGILINNAKDSVLFVNILATQAQLNNLHDQGLVFSPQYQQIMLLYIQLLEAHNLLLEAERAEDIRKADSLKNVISTIIVRKPCLQFLLGIFNIQLDYVKSDTLTPAQLAYVGDVSQMCPYDMGEAVYQARNLRSIYENVSYPSIEECAPPRIAPRSSDNPITDSNLYLYPNPASDELNINFNSGQFECGNIKISDITGRVMEEYRIEEYQSNLKVDVSSFSSGIYFVKYISASGIEKTEKFVILK